MNPRTISRASLLALALVTALARAAPAAEPPPASSTATPAGAATVPALPAMAWLEGCWQGKVNRREFRETWMPLRGGLMLGVSQTVLADKTVDYEYLRLETRPEGVYYVATPAGKAETAWRLAEEKVNDQDDSHTFSFVDPAREFPTRIGYRRASEGWLYTEVEGKVNGSERKVIYPMRRIDCQSGELIAK